MAHLLDVNFLIALLDSDHVDHSTANRWFRNHHSRGWATCAITENGVARVLAQPAYPSGQRTPAEVIQVLGDLKRAFAASYEFWPNEVSLSDDTLFVSNFIAGSRQVTDAYLLGLTSRHRGTLVSFDLRLPWQAIRGGSAKLIHLPV
jgi:toxin-antitoxin system PIN domain toxin